MAPDCPGLCYLVTEIKGDRVVCEEFMALPKKWLMGQVIYCIQTDLWTYPVKDISPRLCWSNLFRIPGWAPLNVMYTTVARTVLLERHCSYTMLVCLACTCFALCTIQTQIPNEPRKISVTIIQDLNFSICSFSQPVVTGIYLIQLIRG